MCTRILKTKYNDLTVYIVNNCSCIFTARCYNREPKRVSCLFARMLVCHSFKEYIITWFNNYITNTENMNTTLNNM